ncbi:helix-turn-helix domain-containing protein [Altererythrobacter soli]|uniref:Helix-turn-helix domain-containing protein n=1 Tax=Croceibacterium soli TaxID=1739690 RepID=A0A6I4UVU9_9SPHN|nr:helix-turn-helix domain-containing protein [Croceibacterium soli]
MQRTERFEKVHAALAGKLAGVTSSLFPPNPVQIGDAAEAATRGLPNALSIARAEAPSIVRSGSGASLTYEDPASEATFGALVALISAKGGPIAADPESLSVLALADRLAATDIPVLINGPTGTGKEVLSRFIHERSPRRDKPFVAINCAAIPETMLEALLFGHQKGAFTGANTGGEGFFRAAEGGTLLLDEIAEMPLSLQAKLLRALQESEVVPVGATTPVKIDVRIIACANRDLPLEVEEGRFRADLYYRLNVFPMALSALRDRPADIVPLAFAMLLRHVPQGRTVPWIADAAVAMLKQHGWPGNIRELENVMRRALVLAGTGDMIMAEHIVFDRAARLVERAPEPVCNAPEPEAPGGAKLSKVVQLSEARAIMDTLDACGGRRAEAARQLGISERTLRYRLASFREAGLAMGGRG